MASRIAMAARLARNGVSPRSLVAHKLTGSWSIRFRGEELESDDARLSWPFALNIWGGEYDFAGFVPQPGWHTIDIGANIGIWSMLAGSRGAKVEAYEPHPRSFAHLEHNSRRWDVVCHQAAVVGPGDGGVVKLWVHPERHWANTLSGLDATDRRELEQAVDVPAVPIDQVLNEEVDLLKIDCEGSEFEILAAEPELLRRAHRIVGEVHTQLGDADELFDRLRGAGFLVTTYGEGILLHMTAERCDT